jgi:hypothetical protein
MDGRAVGHRLGLIWFRLWPGELKRHKTNSGPQNTTQKTTGNN